MASTISAQASWKLSLTVSCAAVILTLSSCRQSPFTVAEEQQALQRVEARQRERTARLNAQRTKGDRLASSGAKARKLMPDGAAELEAVLSKHPDDFDVRLELLQFYAYWAQKAGMDIPTIVMRRRAHILWFIRSHPTDDLGSSPLSFINTGAADSLADVEGYAEGKKAWLSQVDEKGSSAAVLSNAAYFMQVSDKHSSEALLLRAQQLQPDGPWSERLGTLYASMILGTTAIRPATADNLSALVMDPRLLSADSVEQHTAMAEEARQKVLASNDSRLLLKVGSMLLQPGGVRLDFDPVPLAVQCLLRVEASSPPPDQMDEVRYLLNDAKDRSRRGRIRQLPKEGRYEAAMALSDRDRFELFWDLAVSQYSHADTFGSGHEDYLREWSKTAQYALELASVSRKFRNDPDYGNALFNANMMLAFVESKKGNTQRTLDYIREALKAPTATDGGGPPDLWAKVCPFLIEQGRREDVIAFLEGFARIDPFKRDDLLATAAQLRNGLTPKWNVL